MKPNKEKIYDFIKLHGTGEHSIGVSTNYIAEALSMQRSNVSSTLNILVKEKKINKISGRPVLYHVSDDLLKCDDECFKNLVGYDGSLKRYIHLAQAAVLYPGDLINAVLIGEKGTGRKLLAEVMYKFAVMQQVISEDLSFNTLNCREYTGFTRINENDNMADNSAMGLLYIENIQYFSVKEREILYRRIVEKKNQKAQKSIVVISCTSREEIEDDDFMAQCPQ